MGPEYRFNLFLECLVYFKWYTFFNYLLEHYFIIEYNSSKWYHFLRNARFYENGHILGNKNPTKQERTQVYVAKKLTYIV